MFSSWASSLLLLIIVSNGECDPWDIGWLIRVPLHPQETSMWDWAASAQMIMDYLGHDVSQCVQANDYLSRTDCCNTPVPIRCVEIGIPDFYEYGFSCRLTSSLSWENLKKQISFGENCKATPILFGWMYSGGGWHFMVANGYVDNGKRGRYVFVKNPWPVNEGNHDVITYEYYRESRCSHKCKITYYDIIYTGGN